MRFFRHGTLIQQNEKDFKRVFYTTIEYNLNFKLKIFYVLLIDRFVFHNGKYGVSLNEVMLEHELCIKWMLRKEEVNCLKIFFGEERKYIVKCENKWLQPAVSNLKAIILITKVFDKRLRIKSSDIKESNLKFRRLHAIILKFKWKSFRWVNILKC